MRGWSWKLAGMSAAAIGLVLAVMVGLFWALEILPGLAFLILLGYYAVVSGRPPRAAPGPHAGDGTR